MKLTIKGRVQKVGYRSLVDEIAFELGIKGYVKNLENKTVEIIAEHVDENVLKKFSEMIKINEFPIRVDEVVVEKKTPENHKEFEVIEGPLELENRESLEAGAIYMRKLASSMNSMNSGMNKMTIEQQKMTNEQRLMRTELGEKMDNVANKVESFSSSTMDRFDVMEKKYGAISQELKKLSKMADSFDELIEILRMFKPKE